MSYSYFLEFYFQNLTLFLTIGFGCILLCYLSIARFNISGFLDPIHFYWTYTFGVTYSITLGLYILDKIDSVLFLITALSACLLIFVLHICKDKISFLNVPVRLIYSNRNGHLIYILSLSLLVIIYLIIIGKTGFGMFAEVNRFEQNKGIGPLVRIADSIRLFVFSYSYIYIYVYFKRTRKKYMMYFLLFIGLLISSISNGAKFSLLEGAYSIILCFVIYTNHKMKFNFRIVIKSIFLFLISFVFALLVISASIRKSGLEIEPQYFPKGTPIAIEKIFFRTLSNGDQSYLGLPNGVILNIKEGSFFYSIASSFLGKSKIQALTGNDVDLDNVGQKILRYHFPYHDQPGGPVSHFDLYFYHYMPIGLNFIGVMFLSMILASIYNLKALGENNLFMSSVIATLWCRGLVLLLEPAMGLAYLLDFFIVMLVLKMISNILPKQFKKNNIT